MIQQAASLVLRRHNREVVALLELAVQLGEPTACGLLAFYLYYGWGCDENRPRALELARRGADLNDATAAGVLAEFLVESNDIHSFGLALKSASEMNPWGASSLGLCFINGIGVTASDDKAEQCFQAGTHFLDSDPFYSLGTAHSVYHLGLLHGVRGQPVASVECYTQAALLGHRDAIVALSKARRDGQGVTSDEGKPPSGLRE